jgi:hypothetical protein
VRHGFINDGRTIEAIEAYTGREWIKKCRGDAVASFARLAWDDLTQMPGIGFKKAKTLVEMLSAASS